MRHALSTLLFLGVFLLALSPGEADGAKDVRAYLGGLQEAAMAEEAASFERAVGVAVLRDVPAKRLAAQRAELRAAFRDVRLGAVKVSKDQATAELDQTGRIKGKSQVTLVREGSGWRLSSPYAYPIAGSALEERRGKKPVAVQLDLRSRRGAYGTTAYSFRYATGDAKAAKNRMDIWVCHNGDIHARRKGRIADLGKKSLARVKTIPSEAPWGRTAPIVAGHTYVVHCLDARDRDFYVKCRVKSYARGSVDLEWTLLTGGFGAPADIHVAGSVAGGAGADGTDGLCGKNTK